MSVQGPLSRRWWVAAVLAVTAAACGSADGGTEGIASMEDVVTSTSSAVDAELAAEESILALTQCLREEGADIPDPEFDDQGNFRLSSLMDLGEAAEVIDPDDLREAFEACSHHLDGVAQLIAAVDRTEFEDRMVAYAACMRENGYDMPDPSFSFGAPEMGEVPQHGPFGEIDVDDPEFAAANEVCIGVFGETIGPGGFGPAVEDGDD